MKGEIKIRGCRFGEEELKSTSVDIIFPLKRHWTLDTSAGKEARLIIYDASLADVVIEPPGNRARLGEEEGK